MGSGSCTGWKVRSYIGGWNNWYQDDGFLNHNSDGYAYKPGSGITYAYCFSFMTPDDTVFHRSTSLEITIPILRGANFSKSGTLYFKILSNDPTGGSITNDLKPTSANCDASCAYGPWNDQAVHKITFKIDTTNLKTNTRYYCTVGCDRIIGIAYFGYTPSAGYWSAQFNYSTFTDFGAPEVSITDNNNNTFTVSGKDGASGTNNSAITAFSWGYDTSYPFSGKVVNKALSANSTDATKTVYAKAITAGLHGTAKTDTEYLAIKHYVKPSAPGKPKLTEGSYKNGRLTVKKPWTFSWDKAKPANGSSLVAGYRIRLFKNGSSIPLLDPDGNSISKIMFTSDYYCDTGDDNYLEPTECSLTIDPTLYESTLYEFKAGDTVQLGIFAYSLRGDDVKLWNGEGGPSDQVMSDSVKVQNAGIVHAKIGDNAWVEGQVWVKISDTEWKEADTVLVKTEAGWKESV